jgi:hypothetical protein
MARTGWALENDDEVVEVLLTISARVKLGFFPWPALPPGR